VSRSTAAAFVDIAIGGEGRTRRNRFSPCLCRICAGRFFSCSFSSLAALPCRLDSVCLLCAEPRRRSACSHWTTRSPCSALLVRSLHHRRRRRLTGVRARGGPLYLSAASLAQSPCFLGIRAMFCSRFVFLLSGSGFARSPCSARGVALLARLDRLAPVVMVVDGAGVDRPVRADLAVSRTIIFTFARQDPACLPCADPPKRRSARSPVLRDSLGRRLRQVIVPLSLGLIKKKNLR
jgi:hypothetical protein